MDPWMRSAVVAALAALCALGCRKGAAPAEPLVIVEPDTDPYGLAPAPDEPEEEASVPEEEVERPDLPRVRRFRAESGETPGLYARWMQVDSKAIVKALGLRSARGLRAGKEYEIELTDANWRLFEQGRAERAEKRWRDFSAEHHVLDYESHRVARGESARAIAKRHGLPWWLLVDANRGIDLRRLHVGEMIRVPVVADGPAPRDERAPTLGSPGEQAPTLLGSPPTQAPEPPEDPRRPMPAAPEPEEEEEEAEDEERDDVDAEEETAPAPEELSTDLVITVKSGETLGLLAGLARIDTGELARVNDLPSPDRVQAGATLVVPIPPEHWAAFLDARAFHEQVRSAVQAYKRRGFKIRKVEIRQGETVSGIAARIGAEEGATPLLNPGVDLDRVLPGQRLRFAVPAGTSP